MTFSLAEGWLTSLRLKYSKETHKLKIYVTMTSMRKVTKNIACSFSILCKNTNSSRIKSVKILLRPFKEYDFGR